MRICARVIATASAIFAGALALTSCAAAAEDQVVRIAAASDLILVLPEIQELVREQYPDIDMRITYGSSGQFLQQISNGAPFDVYLSADVAYPRNLIERGLARDEDLFVYALGRLAVWTTRDDLAQGPTGPLGVQDLAQPGINKIAIANPRHAPYGKAAISALKKAGVLDDVEPKLVLGENVAQAAEFVAAGSVDAGVVALSLLVRGELAKIGSWSIVPIDAHERIEQGGVVLTNAVDRDAARSVTKTMQSEAGREILRSYGFYLEG